MQIKKRAIFRKNKTIRATQKPQMYKKYERFAFKMKKKQKTIDLPRTPQEE